MNSVQYRQFLVKVKQDFLEKLRVNKVARLTLEEVSQLLYLHTAEEPVILREFLLKGTGKFNLNWDDLLQFLEEDVSLHELVKKTEHSPASATEVIDNNMNELSKLLHYVKQKETNAVQSIRRVPVEVGGELLFLVCMDRELVIFDFQRKAVLNSLVFSYSNMRQKIFEKEEQRRLQREKASQEREQEQEQLDKVEVPGLDSNSPRKNSHTANRQNSHTANRQNSHTANRLRASNLKSSVRGSSISSEKSNDRMLFRRRTESGEGKKRRTGQMRVRNDDVGRLFQMFEQASVQNSITIANAYSQARNNFQKQIVLDKSVLEGDKKDGNFTDLSDIYHRNYHHELTKMRHTSLKLNQIRKVITIQESSHKKASRRASVQEGRVGKEDLFSREKSSDQLEYLSSDKHRLEIVHFSMKGNYLLVSLFNREIRLLHLKRGLSSVNSYTVFERQFKSVVTHLALYQNESSGRHKIALVEEKHQKGQDMQKSMKVMEEAGMTELKVFQLDDSMQLGPLVFDHQLEFSAKCQSVLPFGVVLYNEKGHFSLVELNQSLSQGEEGLALQTVLSNPGNNYRVSIAEVRMHHNMLSFYLCCTHGYVYLFDRLSKRIKYHVRAAQSAVLDLLLIKQDSELIALQKKGNLVILSTLHLQKIFVYQSYHEVLAESKIVSINTNNFYVFSSRNCNSYSICDNEEKQFIHQKPIKILKNRMKMRNWSIQQESKDKPEKGGRVRVFKAIEGRGGKGDFLALLLEHGEICLLDPALKYIGSYLYLRVFQVVDIVCNDSYQFMAIHCDNNTLEVVNIYTQQQLFTVKIPEPDQPAKKIISKTEFVLPSVSEPLKPSKPKRKEAIVLVNFFNLDNSSLFMGVITRGNKIYHYSQKGNVTLSVNLDKRSGEGMDKMLMIYAEECLVLATGGDITVLHRQSYYKKWVISISTSDLVQLRRVWLDDWEGLICIDSQGRIFLVDVNTRRVENISSSRNAPGESNYCKFNETLIYEQDEPLSKIRLISTSQEMTLPTDLSCYFFRMLGGHLVRISKQSGKMAVFRTKLNEFEEFIL